MRISHFFIDRPIFATVLSVILTIVGVTAGYSLPIAEYPEIAPPTVNISATYPGAAPRHRRHGCRVIEQEINGVTYLHVSQSTSRGAVDHRCSTGPTSTRRRCWSRTAWPRPSRVCPRRCAARASRCARIRLTFCWSCT